MRYYDIDGEQYPSVTTILSAIAKPPQLIKWIADQGYDKSQEILVNAGDRGTRIHKLIEAFLVSGCDDCLVFDNDEEKAIFSQFKKWLKKTNPQIGMTEGTLYSKKYKFAGTADLVAIIDKKRVLVDFKTSTRIQRTYGLQLAAYKKAYEEMNNLDIDECYVLHLREKGYTFKKVEEPFDVFLATLKLFEWMYKK